MSNNDLISEVRNFAIKNSEINDIHGFSHIERVYNMCIKIGKELNANMDILKIAALLHDIGRIDEKKDSLNRNHAEISAEKARIFLISNNFKITQNDRDNIIHAIKAHSFSNNTKPQTLEAKILSDADKLDALGAIGIFRTIGFSLENLGGIEQIITHLENKILRLKDQIYLVHLKKIAEKRHEIVLEFYNKLKKERT